ncbi:MAG: alpha/beta hydrolase, partial [Clostridia bacterium]|nr:alpha/beta hydrolase [Clostridia bacterium]
DNIYYQFNYMMSKVAYDLKGLNGGILPKFNLVGHSRGGTTNLQYALDHPDMVDSLVSLGTPYFGSTTANLFGEVFMGEPSDGLDDILNTDLNIEYYERWNDNYETLYKDINAWAFGSYHTLSSLIEAIPNTQGEEL